MSRGSFLSPWEHWKASGSPKIRPRCFCVIFTSYMRFLLKNWIVHVKGIISEPLGALGGLWKSQNSSAMFLRHFYVIYAVFIKELNSSCQGDHFWALGSIGRPLEVPKFVRVVFASFGREIGRKWMQIPPQLVHKFSHEVLAQFLSNSWLKLAANPARIGCKFLLNSSTSFPIKSWHIFVNICKFINGFFFNFR